MVPGSLPINAIAFGGALDDLNRVISSDPRNLQARLTRAIILQVQGEYAAALKACLTLALSADNLVTTTCIASVNSLLGQAKASRELLQAALGGPLPLAPGHHATQPIACT